MPKVLILTASMGEGHNTAARAIKEAILAETSNTAEVLVADPYTRTNPFFNKLMQDGYSVAITRYPRAWKVVFEMLTHKGVVEGMEKSMLAALRNAVRAMTEEFQPDILVSTYPIFSFLVAALKRKDPGFTVPLYTVITDSTRINSAWYRCPCDGSIVADELTADVLRADGVPPGKVHVLGFPVGDAFENIEPAPFPLGKPWKAIFFPGGTSSSAIATLEHLAEVGNLEVTVVTGKRRGVQRALESARMPVRGELLGWTSEMPRLMSTHHVFIGKAGGATVQEAIAAQIPFIVSHVVPGQEEGNISLIEQSGIGALGTGAPSRIRDILRGAFSNNGALWGAWRSNLTLMKKPSAAKTIARFLLDRIPR